ncbi:DUF2806 domain-containing protein [Roseivirga sp. UBA1976]|uniref:DUF2806 domain-containing protein n=1 Tax=Roseivirga sp. UBA1976 TaxID=1947386 RepID=UPI002580F960|nr:DUF2806 domain-containing protein [Roseivirga sp. UBA1976]MEC7754533.1 DUF2806 domain-containing protein [Bacteroidota bacterium]
MSNSNLPEKKNEVKTWLGQFIQDLAIIELPEIVERNLVRSVSKLMTGFVDIPAAYLHEFKRRIERETEAKDLISRANAEDIVEFNRKDQEFIASSASYYSIQQFKEAGNRRAVLEKTINELEDRTISEDAKEEIDEDWLARFAKIANDVSKEDVQLILAKILAGEISKPGSFSTMTLKVLERMDRRAADEFGSLVSHIITTESLHGIIFIAIENQSTGTLIRRNMLSHEISKMINPEEYPRIDDYPILVDIGILRPFQAYKSIKPNELASFQIGSTAVGLALKSEFAYPLNDQDEKSFKCLELTTAGYELLPFITLVPCPDIYFEELGRFLLRNTSHNLIKL